MGSSARIDLAADESREAVCAPCALSRLHSWFSPVKSRYRAYRISISTWATCESSSSAVACGHGSKHALRRRTISRSNLNAGELRNSIRHSRNVDEITRKEGESAILRFA